MESVKRVHCWIVRVADTDAVAVREKARPRRVADPFIADLIAKLQEEVRRERCAARGARHVFGEVDRFRRALDQEKAEAEITWRDTPLHFTESDFDAWERRSQPQDER